MKTHNLGSNQILLFPGRPEPEIDGGGSSADSSNHGAFARSDAPEVVISGSFRKDLPALTREFEELQDLGFRILSPTNTRVVSEADGFVFMEGEETVSPEAIELRHLDAIRKASFVWLHAPEGYVGPSAALEVGFARASGIPVYSREAPADPVLRPLVQTISSPREITSAFSIHPTPPVPAVQPFQSYYARAAVRRGYSRENAQDTLLLMLEEFGELARALRKRKKLRRDSKAPIADEQQELADIFIYVVHMANVLGIDLADAVHKKEQVNIARFLAR